MSTIRAFVETGKKKTFAGALDWPGWCRSGGDEKAAVQALDEYGTRYAGILHAAGIAVNPPGEVTEFLVLERHAGNASTDFGAPAIVLEADREPIDHTEMEHMQALLRAYWRAFDDAQGSAQGRELRKGPRGGGRELKEIMGHVLEADLAYLSRLAWKVKREDGADLVEELVRTRQAVLDALEKAVSGELPERGPRGGSIWLPRYFVRRVAWHVLDHTWEIEDRLERRDEHAIP
jgi:hypothetical protein